MYKKMLFIVVVTGIQLVVCAEPPGERDVVPVTISTQHGTITGLQQEKDDLTYYSFRGIPYAAPPIGALRWADPVAPPPWTDSHLDATKRPSGCTRFGFDDEATGDEDCLYLNLYTPLLPGGSVGGSDELVPVLFYIHGGAFLRGQAPGHAPTGLLNRTMVMVAINYRLGSFGFLASGDSGIPGNFGLLDQLAALQWVHNNIADYGGDPSKVTLLGFSAGGSSTYFHSISPRSRGLFTNAVLMSGSGICGWASRPIADTRTYMLQLAQNLNCSTGGSSNTLKNCMLTKTGKEVLIAQEKMIKYIFWPVPFVPVVDENLRSEPFLPDVPQNLTPHISGSVIIGMVPDEGLFFTSELVLRSKNPNNASDIYDEGVLSSVEAIYHNRQGAADAAKIAESIYYHPSARHSRDALLEQMSEALTDYLFTSCMWDTAAAYVKNNIPVYNYVMSHRHIGWALPVYQKATKIGLESPLLKSGVTHGDCIALLDIMPFPFQDMVRKGTYYGGEFSGNDEAMIAFITDLWANFILTGSPVSKSMTSGSVPEWVPVRPGGPINYYDLSTKPSMIQNTFRHKERNFWTQTLPALLKSSVDNTLRMQHTEL